MAELMPLPLTISCFSKIQIGFTFLVPAHPGSPGQGAVKRVLLLLLLLLLTCVVCVQGDYDELLAWPFRQRVTLSVLDQRGTRKHLADAFRPDPTSSSFQRPTSPMNVASGCPMFIEHSRLEAPDSPYLVNDTIFFKVAVDTADLFNP